MWDFVNNTLHMLSQAVSHDSSCDVRKMKFKVVGRCTFANILLHDTSDKLTVCGGDRTSFNESIKNAGKECQQKAAGWGVSEGVFSGESHGT